MMRYLNWLALVILGLALLAPAPADAEVSREEWKQMLNDLNRGLQASDMDAVADAVRALARDNSARAVEALIKIGVKIEHSKVYAAAKETLGQMDSPEAIEAMTKQLRRGKWNIQVLFCEALAATPGDEITDALIAALDETNPYVMSAAAKALGKRRAKAGIGPLIDRLKWLEKKDEKGVAWADLRQALTDITGHDFQDADNWSAWWQANEARFDPNKDRGDKKEAGTQLREAPEFFEEKIVSKRILFIMDVSGSMQAEDPPLDGSGGGIRIDRVKRELTKVVKALKPNVQFNIVAFSDSIKPWQKRLVPASRGYKAKAIEFINGMQAVGLTHTDKAFEEAFKNQMVTTIIFLSDGAPYKGNPNDLSELPPKILEQIRVANRFRKVRIHTFGFAALAQAQGGQQLIDFLKQIASENDGKFTNIK